LLGQFSFFFWTIGYWSLWYSFFSFVLFYLCQAPSYPSLPSYFSGVKSPTFFLVAFFYCRHRKSFVGFQYFYPDSFFPVFTLLPLPPPISSFFSFSFFCEFIFSFDSFPPGENFCRGLPDEMRAMFFFFFPFLRSNGTFVYYFPPSYSLLWKGFFFFFLFLRKLSPFFPVVCPEP